MKTIRKFIALSCALFVVTSCEDNQVSTNGDQSKLAGEFSMNQSAIIHGSPVAEGEHNETVVLYLDIQGSKMNYCTGTLISPDWVLTAGHCVKACATSGDRSYVETNRDDIRVGFGNHLEKLFASYEADQMFAHDEYVCNNESISHDIGLLHLKTPVPHSVAIPVRPMAPELDLTAAEVDAAYDSNHGSSTIMAEVVGFGLRQEAIETPAKYKAHLNLAARCPFEGELSEMCGYIYNNGGVYISDSLVTGVCSGDSGGPTFLNVDGTDYVMGVSSFVQDNCLSYGGETIVSIYHDFITQHVKNIANDEPEDCKNGVDDNNDGVVDCDDHLCWDSNVCLPEICNNGIDDNENGKIDCEDEDCAEFYNCQPEDCENGRDDNGDGLIDCRDPQCQNETICQKKAEPQKPQPSKDTTPEPTDPTSGDVDEASDDEADNDDDSCSASPLRSSKSPLPWLFVVLGTLVPLKRRWFERR